jgi:hypothetical protein
MSLRKIPTLRIGDLEANIPIIQGGMGVGISLSSLTSGGAVGDQVCCNLRVRCFRMFGSACLSGKFVAMYF